MSLATKRNSSIELLRILAMVFIVTSHFCVHGGFDLTAIPFSFNKLLLQWGTLGNLGVDIFVIISGYFLSTKEFKLKTLCNLFTQVWFYSVVGIVISFLLRAPMSLGVLLKAVFPTLFQEYWFFTAYLVLTLLSPFLNILIKNLNQKSFILLLTVMLTLWVVIPTFTTRAMYGTEIAQFVMFYFIGAYFRKYPNNFLFKKRVAAVLAAVCAALLFLSTLMLNLLGTKIPALGGFGLYFYSRTSLLVVGIAVSLFSLAANRPAFSNRFINTVASCSFGVYLVHDHFILREFLWEKLFGVAEHVFSPWFIVYAIGVVAVIYAGSTLIEFLRQKTVAAPLSNLLYRVVTFFLSFLKKKINLPEAVEREVLPE